MFWFMGGIACCCVGFGLTRVFEECDFVMDGCEHDAYPVMDVRLGKSSGSRSRPCMYVGRGLARKWFEKFTF